jgi:c-di-GMP-binding flagellar brake protein YcgR
MSSERRRYFRINDTVKLSYQILEKNSHKALEDDRFDLIAEQGRRMEVLIAELKHEHPKLIELIALLNQKFERIVDIENTQPTALAYHARDVNMSACGLSMSEDKAVAIGSHLQLFLVLNSGQKMTLEGLVVDCHRRQDNKFVWRVDFLYLSESTQEQLIQHIVQRQSTLLSQRMRN